MSEQENNPYALYPEEQMDRRPRYYDGQFLGSADFIDAQRYDIDRRRRHLQGTVRPGVVAGLEVTGGADKVDIAAGAAVDGFGRQLVLVAAEEKGVREADRGKNLTLYIVWGETTSDQAHADQGTSGMTRFHEMPVIDYVITGEALPDQAIVLAALQVSGAGAVNADDTVRPRAGLRVPGKTPLTLTSNDADPGRATLAAALQIDVPDGTRSNVNHPALRVGGDATVTASMRIGQTTSTGYGGVQTGTDGLVVKGSLAAGGNSAVRGLGVGYGPHADQGVTLTRRLAVGKEGLTNGKAVDVAGNADISGDVAIGGDTRIARTLDVTQATTLRSSLGVSGSTQIGIDLGVTRNLQVGGTGQIDGRFDVGGATALAQSLTVGGSTTIQGTTIVRDRIEATGRANFGQTLAVGGATTLGGNTSITGTLSATGNTTLGGSLTLTGGASVGGGLTAGGNATVRGQTFALGAGVDGKDGNAGKIKYAVHTSSLEIFGAGTNTTNRSIKMYAEAGTQMTGALTTAGALTTGGGATIGGGGSFAGNLSATGTLTVDNNATFKKGMVIGQTGTTGYGAVEQNGNDLVVNGQFAAGGSGGSAMYSLSLGYDARSNKQGQLVVSSRVGIGTNDPGTNLHVAGGSHLDGAVRVTGRLTVQHGTDNGIRFPGNIGGGSGDWAGLRYWVTDGEDTRLELGTGNDPDDIIVLRQDDKDMIVIRNQRVGIGGETGSTRLRLHGTTEYDHGCRTVMAPGARVMICWALVRDNQTFWSNRGFSSITRHEKGRYQLFFDPDFSGNPTVIVTQHGSGNTKDNALVYSVSKTSCYVKTGDASGDRSDRAFTIIAIGPR